MVTGHGKFVLPVFRKTRFLTLAMCEAEVAETCVTKQGIALTVRAVIAFKVGNDTESIVNAGQRFLSDQDQMSVLTGRIFAGHLRSIIGSMTVEEIVTERQKLATEVLETSKTEMAKIGLIVDSLQIQSIDDGDTGYIDAMSAPHKAAIQRQAQIAQAAGHPGVRRGAAGGGAQPGGVRPADRGRPGAVQGRGGPRAGAGRAGRPARAGARPAGGAGRADRAGAARRPSSASSSWSREVVKPAEAEAERIRVLALAEAERMKIQAEAAASHDRVALDRMLIDQLPQIVKEAAGGLAGANVNVLNGADGLGEIAAGLVGQGLTILDSVRRNLGTPDSRAGRDGGTGNEVQRYVGSVDAGPDRGSGPIDIK